MHQGAAADIALFARQENSVSSGSGFLVPAFLATEVLATFLGIASSGTWLNSSTSDLKKPLAGLAFWYVGAHASDNLRMTVRNSRAVIERGARGRAYRFESWRYRARLENSGPRVIGRDRSALRSHVKEAEFEMLLTDERFSATARRLEKLSTAG